MLSAGGLSKTTAFDMPTENAVRLSQVLKMAGIILYNPLWSRHRLPGNLATTCEFFLLSLARQIEGTY